MEVDSLADHDTVEAVDGAHLAPLAVGKKMNVQHFTIDSGAEVPEHDHHHEQAGFIYGGELTFVVDGEEFVVGPGDSYTIPGGEPHAARNEGDEPVQGVDIFSPPRENPAWQD